MKPSYTVFVDTNVFIQLRDIATLPWKDLLPDASAITIMIARPVVEELDRFKNSSRDRLRKRARLALALVDAAASAPDRKLSLRDKPISIGLCLAPRKSPDWTVFPELDPASADDRLVAAAALFGEGAILLSHDRGPRLSAGEIGLIALAPPDAWHLEDEPTDQQQKIARLERELAAAANRSPNLKICFPDAIDGVVTIFSPILKPLPAELKSLFTSAILAKNPQAQLQARPKSIYHIYGSLSEGQIMEYDGEHAQFRTEVERYFDTLHERMAGILSLPRVRFEVTNEGSVSATQFVVQLMVEGFSLLAGTSDMVREAGSSALPKAPAIPRPQNDMILESLRQPAFPSAKPRDPTRIQWLARPEYAGQHGSYGCDDFRPQRSYLDEVGLKAIRDKAGGRFTVAVSANDVAERAQSVDVIVREPAMSAWTDDCTLAYLPDVVAELLTKHGE